MKSINQIFKNDKELLLNSSVQELVDYCHDLENDVIDNKQSLKFNNEDNLTELVRDIYHSIIETFKNDEELKKFGKNKIDYKQSLKNLKKYLEKFSKDNNFRI